MKRTFIDRTIEFISPGIAFRRYQKKHALDLQQRAYEGANKGRRTGDWRTTNASANMEINKALNDLRNRSRSLVQNNPYINHAFQRVLPNNIVGTGIMLSPNFTGVSGKITDQSKKVNDRIKGLWKTWADKTSCDYDGNNNFYGLQHLTVTTVAESGECFLRKVYNTDKAFPLQIQLLEADFLDTSKHDIQPPAGGNRKYYGIEFDSKNQRVAYWLFKTHPVEFRNSESERVPADQIVHIFLPARPGQMRGVPFCAPSIIRIRDLDKYEDAELIRQQIAACFSIFVTDSNTDDAIGTGKPDEDRLEKVEPGIIEHLKPGETVTMANPPTTQGYDPYTRNILRSIAVSMGITYEALTGDLSNVNFSSGRMGWLEAQRNYSHLQWNMLIPKLERVFEWWMETHILSGTFSEDMKSLPVTWTPPRREMIDPLKEGKALELMLRAGLKSWSGTIREQGDNPEDVMRELMEDAALFDKAGLKPTSDPRFDMGRIAEEDLDAYDEPEETKKPIKK